MEPQPETATATATVRVCGQDIQTTAGELVLAGVQVTGPAAFTALSQVVNLRTITLTNMTFSDVGWESLLAGIKACPHLAHLNLTACGLGPKHSADLATIFSSGCCNIDTLCLAKNGLTGATFYSSGNVRDGVDSNLDGISTLFAALKTSQVICIDFSGCGLGPLGVSSVADYVRDATASVVTINCLANNFGDEELSTLLAAVKGTSVRSLCGLTEGQTVADFSDQNLGPFDCKIMAAEFAFQGFIASLASLCVSGNLITGSKNEYSDNSGKWTCDLDLSVLTALGEAMTTSKTLTSIDFSNCQISAKGVTVIAEFTPKIRSIAYLDVSGCNLQGHEEVGAQLMTAANEMDRVRLRAYQVLAFSEVMHERLGSSCTIDVVGDVCSRVADKMRQLHGHEALCSRLVDCGQTWFKVVIRG